jgi:SAM-dependent methyltransferase
VRSGYYRAISMLKASYRAGLTAARDWVDMERASLTDAMRHAAPFSSGRLVDVGCGEKPHEALFRPFVREYIGVEHADTFSQNDSSRRAQADLTYSGNTLPFESRSVDTVLSNQVLEHVVDPGAFFTELTRILKPGGRLILTAPFSFREHSAPQDFHRFTQFALRNYAEQNGLAIDVLSPRGGLWAVLAQKVSAYAVLHVAKLGADLQTVGALGHEDTLCTRPRYWTLPAVVPTVLGVVAAARMLEVMAPYHEDTLGYLLIATKRA